MRPEPRLFNAGRHAPVEAIVLGASAGAVEALSAILPALPGNYPLPLLAVVHSPPDRKSILVELFQAKCRVRVKEGEDKEPIRGGTVYFAPPNYHLLVESERVLSLSSDEAILYSRPSIDVLFESAADAYGPNLAGIVLTGANRDGARGLRAICAAGGIGIVQSPEAAEIPIMPEAAIQECVQAHRMMLGEIADFLCCLPEENRHGQSNG